MNDHNTTVDILAIDDDENKLTAIKSILDDLDLNIIACKSGTDGIRELLKRQVALILLDVNMPGMDGFETAKLIRSRTKMQFIPIIFLTAYSSEDTDVSGGYSLGAVDFIFTPIKPVILRTKVQGFVELYKKTRQVEKQNEELEQLRDHLEEMVAERTSALKSEINVRKKAEKKLKISLEEKEVLLAEIHHRVKNNMAVVSALLELEIEKLPDKKLKELLLGSRSRIKSMAIIHEKLYQAGDFTHLRFNQYVEELMKMITASFENKFKEIKTKIIADEVLLNLNQAIPCALLMNELLINAFKHAFTNREKGNICVRLSEKDEGVELVIEDDGIGLSDDFDITKSKTLGIRLITTLAKQLQASLDITNGKGTRVSIKFSKTNSLS